MKVLIQRTSMAKVVVESETVGSISKGLLLFVCLEDGDEVDKVEEAAEKISKLRIFEDDKGKMNLNVEQAQGQILSVSQFTLSWDGKKGHRPSFDRSMPPRQAQLMYNIFNQKLRDKGLVVETGRFGADMKVEIINDGPVTFHLDF